MLLCTVTSTWIWLLSYVLGQLLHYPQYSHDEEREAFNLIGMLHVLHGLLVMLNGEEICPNHFDESLDTVLFVKGTLHFSERNGLSVERAERASLRRALVSHAAMACQGQAALRALRAP